MLTIVTTLLAHGDIKLVIYHNICETLVRIFKHWRSLFLGPKVMLKSVFELLLCW